MEFWSWTIAVILGISAIISPIATAVINNKYQLKIKNIEIYQLSKRKALENFIKYSTNLNENNTIAALEEYKKSVNSLYIYFKEVPINVDTLPSLNSNELFNEITNIVQSLSKQISKE